MSLIPEYLYSIFTSALWGLSCIGMGSIFSKKINGITRLERYILNFITGCIIWIIIGLILFQFKLFKPVILNVLVYLFGIGSITFCFKKWFSDFRDGFVFDWQVLCLIIVLFAQILYSMIPITAFDALYYHLPLAKRMLETGTISWTPWIIHATLPQNYELFQAIGLSTGGDAGVNLLSWWFGLATILTVIAIGGRLHHWRVGLWSAMALSITPIWFWLSSVPYIESYLAFGFCFMALCLIVKVPVWAIGIGVGWLAGTKYWGLEAASLGFIIWIFKFRPGLKSVIAAILIACCISLFWYIRNIYLFANPFSPYYSNFFSFLGKPRVEDVIETMFSYPRIHHSPKTIQDWIGLPIKLLINPSPEYCDDSTLTWRYVGWFSIFWLLSFLLPKRTFKNLSPVYIYIFISTISWLFIHQVTNLRYLSAILPLMYLLSIMLINHYLSKLRIKSGISRIFINILLILMLLHLAGPTTNRSLAQIPFSPEEQDIFLDENIDGWFVIRELNKIKPSPKVYFLYGEGTRYYCDFPLLSGWHDPYDFYKFFELSSSPVELASWLDSIEVDVLIINERRVRQLLSKPEQVRLNEILADKAFTNTYIPYLVKYKSSSHSFSDISVYLNRKWRTNL